MSFRTGKDGELVYGERPQFREEFLKKYYGEPLNIKAKLGEMFMDFISMEGNLSNSNHPFILAAGDTCEGATSESAFLVNLREYIDLGIENNYEKDSNNENEEESKALFETMREVLNNKVKAVKASKRLKKHPVCLSNEGEISIEMEKVLNSMPNNQGVKADKVLEINVNHEVYNALKDAYENDKEKLGLYTNLLYNQALLIEGLSIEDPVEFTNNICKLMK